MSFLNKLTISKKLTIIAIGGAFALASLAAAFYFMQSNFDQINEQQETNQQIRLSVYKISETILQARRREKDFLLRFDPKYVTKHDEIIQSLNNEITNLFPFIEDNNQLRLLQNIQEKINSYAKAFKTVVQLHTRNGFDHKSGLLGDLRGSVHKVETVLNQFRQIKLANSMLMMRRHEKDFIARKLDKYLDKMNAQYQQFLGLLHSSSLTDSEKLQIQTLIKDYHEKFLKLAEGIKEINIQIEKFRASVHAITPKLTALKNQTEKLWFTKKQQLEQQINHSNIIFYGILFMVSASLLPLIIVISRSINQSTYKINSILKEIAGGNATLSDRIMVSGNDEMAEIAKWFNLIMEKLQTTLNDVSDLANHLTEISTSAQKAKDKTTAAIYSQVQEISHVVNSIESMTTSIEHVADNANDASRMAIETDNCAKKGHKEVSNVVNSIQQLASNVEQAADSVKQIDDDSRSIDSVVAMINGIAEQTNLLALNAAIEAARAGEAGRGFAVVADEVRTLSQRTTASTDEIKETIQSLQQGTTRAVEIMNQSRERATNSVEQAQQAGESLNIITHSVSNIVELNAIMSKAAMEQSTLAKQINKNIVEIDEATKKLADSAQQTMSDSGDLSQTATLLKMMSNRFGSSATEKKQVSNDLHEVDLF